MSEPNLSCDDSKTDENMEECNDSPQPANEQNQTASNEMSQPIQSVGRNQGMEIDPPMSANNEVQNLRNESNLELCQDRITDGLSFQEFRYLYRSLERTSPDFMQWKEMDEKIQRSADQKENTENIVNKIVDNLREYSPEAYDQALSRMRGFSVTVQLPTGEMTQVNIRPFERVVSLKQHLRESNGYNIERQRLFDRQSELRDLDTLDGRLIVHGAVIRLLIRGEGFEIFVQGISARNYVIRDVNEETTVERLKEKIKEKEDIDVSEQMLKYGTRTLEANKTIGSYGIRQGSTVHVSGRLKGGRLMI